MTDVKVFAFDYKGTEITFESNGEVMINATEMAKPFGKQPKDFIRLAQTEEFAKALAARLNILPGDLMEVKNGGNNFGTWMHHKLALKFAAWLSPEFELWIYDRIEELGKYGFTATESRLDELVNNPDLLISLATQLKVERQQKQLAEAKVKEMEPKVLFADSVNAASNSILIGDLSKLLKQNGIDIGQNRLFDWMRDNGYLIKFGERKNMPTQKAMEMQLFDIVERTHQNRKDNSTFTSFTTKVTGKGQLYFVNKFLKHKAA